MLFDALLSPIVCKRGSQLSFAIVAGVISALMVLAPARASEAPAPRAHVRILAQDAQGVTVEAVYGGPASAEVLLAGRRYARLLPQLGVALFGAPGAPELPRMSALLGVPAGAHPRLQIVSVATVPYAAAPPLPAAGPQALDHEMLEESRIPDPAAYAPGVTAPEGGWAFLGDPQIVRDLQVTSIVFQPLHVEAASGRGEYATRIVARLTFGGGAPAGQSLGGAALSHDRLAGIYSPLLNIDAATEWITPPAHSFDTPVVHSESAGALAWKLLVRTSGLRRVPFAALAAQGFPAGHAFDELALELRDFDDTSLQARATPVAIEVRDANSNGVFDGDDDFVFAASDLVERYGVKDARENLTDINVYWLTLSGSGARIGSVDGWPAMIEPTVPATFTDSVRVEKDGSMLRYRADPAAAVRDQYVWFNSDTQCSPDAPPTGVDTSFVLGPHPAAGTARFRAVFRSNSGWFLANAKSHDVTLRLQNAGSPLSDTLHVATRPFSNYPPTDTMLAVADVPLDKFPGTEMTLHYTGTFQDQPPIGQVLSFSYAPLDYAELLYPRYYQSDTHALTFRDGGVRGNAEYHVSGFADTAVVVYDVSTPTAPLRLTLAQRDAQIIGGAATPGGVEIRIRAVVNTPRRYVAMRRADLATLPSADVVRDSLADLASPLTAADYIMIAPDSFSAVVRPLLDLRRAQGLRVQFTRLEDVFDEFNGGVRSELAIRRYLAVQLPAYALLVGDGSEDHKTASPSSPPDIMPPHLILSSGELIAADGWFACVDNLRHPSVRTADILPDLALGRLPAGSLAECQTIVDKILAYETRSSEGLWRERFGLVADDQWSSNYITEGGRDGYTNNSWESAFTTAQENSVSQLAASGLTRVIPVRYYLADSTTAERNRYALLGRPAPTLVQMIGYVTGHSDIRSGKGWNAYFYNQLSDSATGCNVIYYQGHGNRWQATHERMIWEYNDQPGCLDGSYSRHNVQCNLQNYGRPFVMFLFGCHLSEFERKEELNSCIEDAIGEKLVLLPGAGAVASFGSTAFEYADPNVELERNINAAFWLTPPPGSSTDPHLSLGRVIASGLVSYAAAFGGATASGEATLRYVLLGDPATRIATRPPSMVVLLNGQPVTNGQRVRSATGFDVITATLEDENGIDSLQIHATESDNGAALAFTAMRTDTLSAGGLGDRRWSITVPVALHVGEYDIVLRATDRAQRTSEFRLSVHSQVDMTVNGRPFRFHAASGDVQAVDRYVPADARFQFRIVPPTTIVGDSIQLSLDGVPLMRSVSSEGDSVWIAQASFAATPLAAGPHTLLLRFTGFTYTVPFEVAQSLAVQQVYGYPTPFTDRVGVQYQLTQKASRAQVRVYSLAGRLLRELEAPAEAGLNVVQWDGTDVNGDQAANGVYLCLLRAWDSQGHALEGQTRLARTR